MVTDSNANESAPVGAANNPPAEQSDEESWDAVATSSIRLNLKQSNSTLVVDYSTLVERHKQLAVDRAAEEDLEGKKSRIQATKVELDNPYSTKELEKLDSAKTLPTTAKRAASRWDQQDEYEDDFIDDSEEFGYALSQDAPPAWEWGWFAWKGDLDTLFKSGKGKVVDDQPIASQAQALVVKKKKPASAKKKKGAVLDDDDEADDDADKGNQTTTEKDPNPLASAAPAADTGKKKKKPVVASTAASKRERRSPSKMDRYRSSLTTRMAGKMAEIVTPKKKKEPEPELPPLPPLVLDSLAKLRTERLKCDFSVKKNFPPSLKPLFNDCVTAALDHQALAAPFWTHITNILPYNTFTMKKLASRQVFPDRIAQFKQELSGAYKAMEKEVKKQLAETGKVRWDERIRIMFWTILCLEWEVAEMDNQTKTLEKQPPQYTEGQVRRAVYQTVAGFWPQSAAFDTGTLSMQYSQFKLKRAKAVDDHGFQYPEKSQYGLIRADPFAPSISRKKSERDDGADAPVPGTPEKRRSENEGGTAKKSKVN
ncbi:hypothetical protein HDV03_001767 [Kappamyces sp. JEL0829]|nr:hypothetical protein HDV03_001767 [Kappamyces sp. JEL0829]